MKKINYFILLVLVSIFFISCSDNNSLVNTESINSDTINVYTETFKLNPDSSIVIDGNRTNLFGWDYIEIHSDIEIQVLANFETIDLLILDFKLSGVRWENMRLINFRPEVATVSIIIKKNND